MNFDDIMKDLGDKVSSISIDEEKINKLIRDAKEKIEGNEMFSNIIDDIRLAMEMVLAWKKGEYEDLSQKTVFLVLGGLLYLVNPLNILPKFLKKTIVDDIIILVYILKKVKSELEAYKAWKAEVDPEEEDKTVYIEIQ